MAVNVFNRVEKKYLLTEVQYWQMRERLKGYMEADSYGLHNIRNIYFDTDTDELIRTSIEKPVYKEKFRVRCYGQPTAESDMFLEIKKKYKGVVNKRRMMLRYLEMEDYLERGIKPAVQGQICEEVDYLLRRCALRPKLYLAYDRIALYGREDADFRITFDQNIRSRRENRMNWEDENTNRLLAEEYRLMEVKLMGAIPLWFVHILTELEIKSRSFSKYGSVYQRQVQEGSWKSPVGWEIGYGTSAEKDTGSVPEGMALV